MSIKRIVDLLDEASIIADNEANVLRVEPTADSPYTRLAQLIDDALARAEQLRDEESAR